MIRMLLRRSIFLQVCLLIITQCNCQDYETGYSVDESDIHSDVQDDSGHPDYSKYYQVDTSAPLVSNQGNSDASGFTSPIEFSTFFATEFGASSNQEVAEPKNPFTQQKQTLGFLHNQQFPDFTSGGQYPIDYFEEAQKQQRAAEAGEEEGIGYDNPTYISHGLPPTIEGDYSSDVEKIQPKPNKPKKTRKDYDYEKSKKDYEYEKNKQGYDYEDADKEGTREAERYKTPDYSYEYQPSSGKYADYNIGKSSSTVSQNPEAPGYFEIERLTQTPTPTPYQKYSFQPVTEEGLRSKYLEDLISTVAPFNPAYNKVASTTAPKIESQPSENIPAHLKDKNCRRVRKHISGHDDDRRRRKREAMNCYVCEDPSNNSKYTQCSYAVEPEPINDYSGKSERYSIPARHPSGFRYKRYSGDEYYADPYEYIKKRTEKSFSEPQETSEYGEYKIPDFYTDEIPDKSYSELQSEAIAKNPANCHKEESEGMTCTICKDPKTGGNFEQCSYTSEPKEQKYAYVAEKKYDSNDPEEGSESKSVTQTKDAEKSKSSDKKVDEHEPITLPSIDTSKYTNLEEFRTTPLPYGKLENFGPTPLPSNNNDKYSRLEDFKPAEDYKANYKGHDKFKLSDEYNSDFKSSSLNKEKNSNKEEYNPSYNSGQQSGDRAPKKLINDEPYDIPKHFAESTIKEQKSGVLGLEPSLYGSSDSSEVEEDADSKSEPYKEIDEYHFKLFPEFSKEESQQAEVIANDNPVDRKDVEEVLAEFSKKDRSACKKAEKNGMTCYLCVDQKGIQHEECMYISESKPQASHVAYHEVKQIKSPENQSQQQEQQEQAPAATEQQNTSLKKAPAAPFVLEAAASEEHETKIRYKPTKSRRRNVKKTKEGKEPIRSESAKKSKTSNFDDDDEKLSEDDVPHRKTPAEFVVGDEEGAFSAETKPVYSKTLGVKLPRYMIEKSEFEKEFDEFSGNHF